MKKLLILLLTFVFAASCLVGCGGDASSDSGDDTNLEVENDADADDNDTSSEDTQNTSSLPQKYSKPSTYHEGVQIPKCNTDSVILTLTNLTDPYIEVVFNDDLFTAKYSNTSNHCFAVNSFPQFMIDPFESADVQYPDMYDACMRETNSEFTVAIQANQTVQSYYDMISYPPVEEQAGDICRLSELEPITINGLNGYVTNLYINDQFKEPYVLFELPNNYVLQFHSYHLKEGNLEKICALFLEGYELFK